MISNMTGQYRFSVFLAALLLWSPLLAQKPGLEGSWEGALAAGGGKLRIRFHFTQAEGKWSAKMDSPDQGAFGLAVSEMSVDGNTVALKMPQFGITFDGALDASGLVIKGKFVQGGAIDLELKKIDAAAASAAPKRPQTPTKPFPYQEFEVAFPNKADSITLAGTLTKPQGNGPFPAVILITGSGPQDRDESLMGHKPFWILADYLTRKGIAVLRYDDRGIGQSTGQFPLATTADFAKDAAAAVDYLKTRSEIDPKRIGLLGHSEGGVVAPMVATTRNDVAFVVLLAGTAVPGEQILYEQGAAIAMANGATSEAAAMQKIIQENLFRVLKEEPDPVAAEAKLRKAMGNAPSPEAQIKQINSPWFRYFLTYDPAVTFAKMRNTPVLALFGEKDLQVLASQNRGPLEAALKKSGNKDVTITVMPGLNHLFQTAQKGSPSEYATIEETMSPAALETMATWIRQRTGLEPKAAAPR